MLEDTRNAQVEDSVVDGFTKSKLWLRGSAGSESKIPCHNEKKDYKEFECMEDAEGDGESTLYDEVDVTVGITPQEDDTETPAFTFRSVFLGCIWAIFLASCNVLFSFRTNAFVVPTGLSQLISYPMGLFLARVLPKGFFNPGPFSVKEHVLIYVIAGSAGGLPYGIETVVMQKGYMMQPTVTFLNSLAWVATTQVLGYGIAGMCRRFLVKPKAMLWVFQSLTLADGFAERSTIHRPKRR
jgi:OPT oligopeptide transporter protein